MQKLRSVPLAVKRVAFFTLLVLATLTGIFLLPRQSELRATDSIAIGSISEDILKMKAALGERLSKKTQLFVSSGKSEVTKCCSCVNIGCDPDSRSNEGSQHMFWKQKTNLFSYTKNNFMTVVAPSVGDRVEEKTYHSQCITVPSGTTVLALGTDGYRWYIVRQKKGEERPIFLQNYKNPCFYDNINRALICLPYFQLLGNDKCGTTDLFDRLLQHPQILRNGGNKGKETFWWAWRRYGYWWNTGIKHRFESLLSYTRFFKSATKVIEKTVKPGTNYHHLIVGDGSPMTFWDLAGWSRIPQNLNAPRPVKTTAHLIKHLLPNCKLMVIFRNPTARTYSDYHFLGQLTGKSTTVELFHGEVLKSIDLFEECARVHGATLCAFNWSFTSHLPVRIHISMYSLQLEQWLKVYKREELLILRTEDYQADMKGTLQNITKFLEIQDYPEKTMESTLQQKKKNETKRKKLQGPIKEETKQLLDNYYAAYNEKLSKLAEDQRFLWKD